MPTSRAAADRIPTEILVLIFHLHIGSIDDKRVSRRTQLMLVRRAWENIIESTPTFWATVSNHMTPQQIQLSLARSMAVPLQIEWTAEPSALHAGVDPLQGLSLVMGAAHRWRRATILLPKWSSATICPQLVAAAPRLEELQLGVLHRRRSEPSELAGEVLDLGTSRLHALSFRGVLPRWSAPVFQTVTSLHLDSLVVYPTFLRQLIDGIGHCPRLESLRLIDINFVRTRRLPMDITHAIPIVKNDSLLALKVTRTKDPLCKSLYKRLQIPNCRNFNISDIWTSILDAVQLFKGSLITTLRSQASRIVLEVGCNPTTSRNRLTLKVILISGSVSTTKLSLKVDCGHNSPLRLLEDTEMLSILQSRPLTLSLGMHYPLFRSELPRECQLAGISMIVQKLGNVVRLKIGEHLGQIRSSEVLGLMASPKDGVWHFPSLETLEIWQATLPEDLAGLIRKRQDHAGDGVAELKRVAIMRCTLPSVRVPDQVLDALKSHGRTHILDP